MNSNKQFTIVLITVLVLGICVAVGIYLYMRTLPPVVTPTEELLTATTTSPGGVSAVGVFYIALEDGGKQGEAIGCGDSVVLATRQVATTTAPLRAALVTLLADKRQMVEGGLYNSLYQSNLAIDSLSISASGVATVRLSGQYALGGVCDSPRFVAQIKETVEQFPTVTSSNIFINSESLETVGSEQ